MKYSITDILIGFFKTLLLLVVLHIFTTAVLPALGISSFKPAFNVLIVLFLAFKIDVPFLAWMIFSFQYTHSLFSIEGWASGTLAGITIALAVRYLRDLINFSTAISTIIVVQIFQILWFVILALLLSIKMGDFGLFFSIFVKYIPESVFLSLISPWFFGLLDNFWNVGKKNEGVGI